MSGVLLIHFKNIYMELKFQLDNKHFFYLTETRVYSLHKVMEKSVNGGRTLCNHLQKVINLPVQYY